VTIYHPLWRTGGCWFTLACARQELSAGPKSCDSFERRGGTFCLSLMYNMPFVFGHLLFRQKKNVSRVGHPSHTFRKILPVLYMYNKALGGGVPKIRGLG